MSIPPQVVYLQLRTIHSSGANSHVVQILMLRPMQIMFIPIGWQKLFKAAITAANNVVATI